MDFLAMILGIMHTGYYQYSEEKKIVLSIKNTVYADKL